MNAILDFPRFMAALGGGLLVFWIGLIIYCMLAGPSKAERDADRRLR